jgi:hypothetical protein
LESRMGPRRLVPGIARYATRIHLVVRLGNSVSFAAGHCLARPRRGMDAASLGLATVELAAGSRATRLGPVRRALCRFQ